MDTAELISAVNYFIGSFDQPIKLEILYTGAEVDVDSLIVFGCMRIGGEFCFHSLLLPLTLKAPIISATDDKFSDIFPNFRKKLRYDIS